MKLIINADDFGLSRGVNLGIIETCQRGVLRSTTLMAGMAAEKHAAELAEQCPNLKVGVHLRLTAGTPLADNVPSLVNDHGVLQPQSTYWEDKSMNPEEIERELRAQIEHFLKLGLELSHLDGHHHCHMHELVAPVVAKLGEEYQVPVRPCTGPVEYNGATLAFSDAFYGEQLTVASLLEIVKEHLGKADVLEVMCHPALIDELLLESSGYAMPRTRELAILTDPSLPETLKSMGVTLTDYSCLSM